MTHSSLITEPREPVYHFTVLRTCRNTEMNPNMASLTCGPRRKNESPRCFLCTKVFSIKLFTFHHELIIIPDYLHVHD